jgi:hypothetical protein
VQFQQFAITWPSTPSHSQNYCRSIGFEFASVDVPEHKDDEMMRSYDILES